MNFYIYSADQKLKANIEKIINDCIGMKTVKHEDETDYYICSPIEKRGLFDMKPLILFGRFYGKATDSASEISVIPESIIQVDISTFGVMVDGFPRIPFKHYLIEHLPILPNNQTDTPEK